MQMGGNEYGRKMEGGLPKGAGTRMMRAAGLLAVTFSARRRIVTQRRPG